MKFNKKKENIRQSEKGITLIILIITIIIIFIIAGTTINMIIGEGGFIEQSLETQNKQKEQANSETGEVNGLLGNLAEIDKEKLGPNGKPLISSIIVPTYRKNIEAEDIYGNRIIVPAGFKVVPHGTDDVEYTYAEGENKNKPTVQDGIVIEDDDGNQFVWIPIGNIINKEGDTKGESSNIILGRYENYTADENGKYTPAQVANVSSYTTPVTISDNYQELPRTDDTDEHKKAKDLEGFIRNTLSNGGYYLARYEASYRNGVRPYSMPSEGTPATTAPTTYASKQLWNFVTQEQASKASQAMYAGKEDKFVSDLVNSYSWDTAIIFIQTYSENGGYASQVSKNAEGPANTGVRTETTTDKVCNIYDMASNIREWTTEYSTRTSGSTVYHCVDRGGLYGNSGFDAGSRDNSNVSYLSSINTFRPIIYCKPID